MIWDDLVLQRYPCLKKQRCQRNTSLKGLCESCRSYPYLIMEVVAQWNFGDDSDGLLFTEGP
jgi:hypothetical protein